MAITDEHISHPGQSLRFLRFEVESYLGQRHRHRQMELTWIESGTGLRYVGDSVEPFEPDDLVLLGPMLPHAWTSARQTGKGCTTVLQFPPELILESAMPELQRLVPLIDMARRGIAISGSSKVRIIAILRSMADGGSMQRLTGLMEILHLMHEQPDSNRILASPAAHYGAEGKADGRLAELITWIHRNISSALPLNDAAAIVHVTPAAFSRYFTREIGKNYSAYVNDIRCSEACVLLRQTGKPVAVIAAACGFNTASHFHREFSRRTAMTPFQYRKRPHASPRQA